MQNRVKSASGGKSKILLAIIIILMVGIGVIQYQIFRVSKQEVVALNSEKDSGQVKSAQIEEIDTKLPELKLDQIAKFPQRKEGSGDPRIYANNYILIDVATAYLLSEKDSKVQVPIASTTKIMTAIIVLENYQLDEIVTISQNAASQIGSDIYLMTNEKMTVKNLLYALLVKSGNDAAMALAEHINPGGLEEFVRRMNQKAEYLGLKDTEFKDPSGLDDSGHSTAFDLAVLAAYAMRNKDFNDFVETSEYTIISTDGQQAHKLETSNRLIDPKEPLYYPLATGLKTGFTPEAGHCLVAAANKDGHNLVSVVLKTFEDTKEASAKESKKFLQWGFDSFEF